MSASSISQSCWCDRPSPPRVASCLAPPSLEQGMPSHGSSYEIDSTQRCRVHSLFALGPPTPLQPPSKGYRAGRPPLQDASTTETSRVALHQFDLLLRQAGTASSRAWVISRRVTGRTCDASSVTTAAVCPSNATNSTSQPWP